MGIKNHLNIKSLHHAYLVEGEKEPVLKELLDFLNSSNFSTTANPDFYQVSVDSFKMDDARYLKSLTDNKSFSGSKKIFIVSANSFLLEAQNAMLKIFEEPIEDTHFFIIVPSIDGLLPTFVSRFYLIKNSAILDLAVVEEFLKMPLVKKLDFIKELVKKEDEDDEGNEIPNSPRTKAIEFLNKLEKILHTKLVKVESREADVKLFEHIFKTREFLRQPGSTPKMLLESVALMLP